MSGIQIDDSVNWTSTYGTFQKSLHRETAPHSVNPDFALLVSQGKRLPILSWFHHSLRYNHTMGTDVSRVDGIPRKSTWDSWGISAATERTAGEEDLALMKGSAIASATNSALANFRSGDVNLGVAFASLRDTASLFRTTAVRLAAAGIALKNGRVNDAARNLGLPGKRSFSLLERDYRNRRVDKGQLISDGWLELQFGWKPLLNDVYGSASLLADHTSLEENRIIRSVGYKDFPFKRLQSKRTDSVYGVGESFNYSAGCRARVVLYAIIDDYSLFLENSMGLNNPLLVGHDLVRFSYILDWFYPLAATLQAIGGTQGLSFLDGSSSTSFQKKITNVYRNSAISDPEFGRSVVSPFSYNEYVEEYDRTKLTNFPTLVVPPINIQAEVDSWKIATSMALLHQAFGGRLNSTPGNTR